MNVEAAARAFGSTVRMHLIRHYAGTPGSQREAMDALGLSQRAVSVNTRLLVELGVVIDAPNETNPNARRYSVDQDRLRELQDALVNFTSNA